MVDADPTVRRIPPALTLAVTAFTAVMVPVYWRSYGPQNFLSFCDIALFMTLAGMWTGNRLAVSMAAVAILIPQMIWIADVASGARLIGMTGYMFDSVHYSLTARLLSTFHGWLPVLLVWLVRRMGYDRRAIVWQTILCWVVLLICDACFVPPGTSPAWRAFNLNYVFGLGDGVAQTRFPPLVWLGILMTGIPVLFYLPTHWVLRRAFGKGDG